MSPVETFFYQNDLTLHTYRGGDGSPLLLLHPFTSHAGRFWVERGLFGQLGHAYRVLAPDFRGHGRSAKPHDEAAYGLSLVEDMVALLDHLQIERAHVAGYSMGAEVALKLAVRRPERLGSLILGGSAWSGAAERRLYAATAHGLKNEGSFRALLAGVWPVGEEGPSDQDVADFDAMLGTGNDIQALAACAARAEACFVDEAELRRLQAPVLGIVGEMDPERENFSRLQGVVGDMELLILEGKDHLTTPAHPDFLRQAEAFLARQR